MRQDQVLSNERPLTPTVATFSLNFSINFGLSTAQSKQNIDTFPHGNSLEANRRTCFRMFTNKARPLQKRASAAPKQNKHQLSAEAGKRKNRRTKTAELCGDVAKLPRNLQQPQWNSTTVRARIGTGLFACCKLTFPARCFLRRRDSDFLHRHRRPRQLHFRRYCYFRGFHLNCSLY